MNNLKFVTDDHTQPLSTGEADWINERLADDDDLTNYFDNVWCDAELSYTVYLDGRQIHPAPNDDGQPEQLSALASREIARHSVIRAALHLAATEWDNGSVTPDDSMSLDNAHDQLSTALDAYVEAANKQATPTPEQLAAAAEPEPTLVYPSPGSTIPGMAGYVVGKCTHRVAASEWRAGYRVCERCPHPTFEADEATDISPESEIVPEHLTEVRTWLVNVLLDRPAVRDAFPVVADQDEVSLLLTGHDHEYRLKVTAVIPAE